LAHAMRICEANFGNLLLYDGEGLTRSICLPLNALPLGAALWADTKQRREERQ
jgi:hypothetical protein